VTAGGRKVHFGREKPAPREWGGRLPAALVFPGRDRAALSALGWQAVYRLMHERPELAVERVFAPEGDGPWVSEESGAKLSAFPVVAFSLTYEEDYPLVVSALANSGIPPNAVHRPAYPLVLGGGPPFFLNAAPIMPAMDAAFCGEAEAGFDRVVAVCRDHIFAGADKQTLLSALADLPGMYVPGRSATPVRRAVSATAGSNRLCDPACSAFVSPQAEFKDMLLIEVNRGCPYGCRFCAAGFIYRPPRQASLEDVWAIVEDAKPMKVGLVGTALTDWPDLLPLLERLREAKIKFSLSSVRADGVTRELLSVMRLSGARTLTLALEGASDRLRRAANKNLREEDFLRAVKLAGEFGVNHLKIYCIVGWPGETEEDFVELEDLVARACALGSVGKGKKGIEHATLGVNCLIPKPFTPMQWAPMPPEEVLEAALERVKGMAKRIKGLRVQADRPWSARLQGLLARGDERLFPLITAAAEKGWKKALYGWDGDVSEYLDRERGRDEVFPWEIVDIGVSRASLWREWEKYRECLLTAKCPPTGCETCGRCGLGEWLASAE